MYLDIVVREGLPEEVTLKLRRARFVHMWGTCLPDRGNSGAKALRWSVLGTFKEVEAGAEGLRWYEA